MISRPLGRAKSITREVFETTSGCDGARVRSVGGATAFQETRNRFENPLLLLRVSFPRDPRSSAEALPAHKDCDISILRGGRGAAVTVSKMESMTSVFDELPP